MFFILAQRETSYFNADYFVSTVTAQPLSNDTQTTKT